MKKSLLLFAIIFTLMISIVTASRTLILYDPMGYGSSGTTINSTYWNNTAGCTQISATSGYLECLGGKWLKSFPLDTNFGLDTTDYFQIEFYIRSAGADDGVLFMDEEPNKTSACVSGGQRGFENISGDCLCESRFGMLKIDGDNNDFQVMLPNEAGLQTADTSFWGGSRWWTYIYNSSGYFIKATNFNSPNSDTYPTLYHNPMGDSTGSPTNPLNYIGIGDWDSANPEYGFIQISRFTVYELCEENWQPYYTSCTIGDNHTLLYNDTNGCPNPVGVPADNGTVSSCNYCTLTYHTNDTVCIDYLVTTYPVYDNFETCCNVTSIPEDCNLPANTTITCVGLHESGDVSGITIDGLVEIGRNFVDYAPVIVIVTLAILGLGYFGIKKFKL